VLIAASWSGHILGTSRRDRPRSNENHRDLSRRSDRMRGAFALVREMLAQDPAYRSAHPLTGGTCASAEGGMAVLRRCVRRGRCRGRS
jgi:hypothetical protein